MCPFKVIVAPAKVSTEADELRKVILVVSDYRVQKRPHQCLCTLNV
jgi:hypothetical protein